MIYAVKLNNISHFITVVKMRLFTCVFIYVMLVSHNVSSVSCCKWSHCH